MSRIKIKDQVRRKYLAVRQRVKRNDISDDDVRNDLLKRQYYLLGQLRVYNKFYLRDKFYRKKFLKTHGSRMAEYQKLYGLKRRGKKWQV